MKRLFSWNEQEACHVGLSLDGLKYHVYCVLHTVDGDETETLIGLDTFQAVQLLEELQDFVKTRKPHKANNMLWCVRDGGLYVNDVHICNLKAARTPLQVLEVLSTLLTANKTSSLFVGCPYSYGDVALEQWIQTRLDTFNEVCEF